VSLTGEVLHTRACTYRLTRAAHAHALSFSPRDCVVYGLERVTCRLFVEVCSFW
jgi:hypothetical protein